MMRGGLFLAACVTILLGVAAAEAWSSGARAMHESDALLALGKSRPAAVQARRAAESALPWSPYPALGYARLEAIAMAAEVEGRSEDAAFAWRAMRSAAMATRPASAGQGKVAIADEGILRVARSPASGVASVASARESLLRSQLAERP